jgi:acyl-lipid omega-6 desaturase (Delta-12 desaturase)
MRCPPGHQRLGISLRAESGSHHYPEELREQAKRLTAHCKNYCEAIDSTAIWQLVTSIVPFVFLFSLVMWLMTVSFWLALPAVTVAGGFLVRLFALQHDCGHGSFFGSRKANEITGHLISVLTFTPYDHWRRSHAMHHATSGNLDRRGIGDIQTKTVREYQAMSLRSRLLYRLYRNPAVVILIGPPVFFLVLQRLALGSRLPWRDSWKSLLTNNAGIVLVYGALSLAFGPVLVLKTVVPIACVGAWIGGALFYLQHQFEETLWEGADEWDLKVAALKGSSHMILPSMLNWITCDIGLHHIHHLNSRIPNYRLKECMAGSAELQNIAPQLTLIDDLRSLGLALWDEPSRRLISFREYARIYQVSHKLR